MTFAMIAGTAFSLASLVCQPGGGPAQSGGAGEARTQIETDASVGDGAASAGRVKLSEAPYERQFTDGMLNKVWVSCAAGVSVKDFADAVGKGAERGVFVDWERLKGVGIKPEMLIGVPMNHVYIEQAMRIANERLAAGGATSKIAARRSGDMVEISTQETFDRREIRTVSFDLRPLVTGLDQAGASAKFKEILHALTSTIDPEGWADNGGDTSRQTMAEGRMFVVAPARIQTLVAWFVGQLSDRPVVGEEALHAGEPVQTLELKTVPVRTPDAEAKELRAQLKTLRRELAWKKAALGEALTTEDQAAMDDARAVHAVGASGPSRAQVEQEKRELAAKVEAVKSKLAALEAAGH